MRKTKVYSSHNPNILTHMDERNAEILTKKWWRGTPEQKQFPFQFQTLYNQAVGHVASIDTEGVLLKAFGILPIAPRLDLIWGKEQADVLEGEKFGGIPDFRSAISASAYLAEKHPQQYKSVPREDTILKCWPIGPDGQRMLFVGEFVVPSHVVATFDYFMHEQIPSHYSKETWPCAPFDSKNDFTPLFNIKVRVFKSNQHFFESPQMDAYVRFSSFIDDELDYDDNLAKHGEGIMDSEEYVALVKSLIPKECFSETSIPLIDQKLGFDLDSTVWEIFDAPKFKFDWELEDKLHEGPFSSAYDCFHLFGKPRSQQTEQRYFDPNGYNGPRRLTPFLHWHETDCDMDHQLYFQLPGKFEHWGKDDASCT